MPAVATEEQELGQAGGNEQHAEPPAGPGRGHRRPDAVAAPAPQRRAQQPAAVQRRTGSTLKTASSTLIAASHAQAPPRAPAPRPPRDPRPASQKTPPSSRLAAGRRRRSAAPTPGSAASPWSWATREQPQRDAVDAHAAPARHHGVRDLVRQESEHEDDGGHDADHHVGPLGAARIEARRRMAGQPPGDQGGHDQHAPVRPDGTPPIVPSPTAPPIRGGGPSTGGSCGGRRASRPRRRLAHGRSLCAREGRPRRETKGLSSAGRPHVRSAVLGSERADGGPKVRSPYGT